MKESRTDEFSYDVIAYPSQIIAQTNPDRLAAVAKLYGMNPAPVEKCRVLELGCGTGTNLNWMASYLSESEFVGIDLSQIHIAEAKSDAANIGLSNVKFYQQDVLEISEKTFGKFDYIIAHGLFSWVPDFVREKVLSLYDELLNPDGIGFISYNVYPGCLQRRIVIDMMRFHTREIEGPLEKVQKGIELVKFAAENVAQTTVYQQILRQEFEYLTKYPVQNIYHDELSEINQPFYFTEFMEQAEKHNLRFLSESENLPFQRDSFSEDVVQVLEGFSRNTIEYEQYSDFMDSRRFRQTLLCKKQAVLATEPSFYQLRELYISSLLNPVSPQIDLNPESFKEFTNFKGQSLDVGHNPTKIVLSSIVGFGSHLKRFDELAENAVKVLQSQGITTDEPEREAETLASLLLQLYSPNAVGLHTAKPNIIDYVSEKPKAIKFAVWQANRGDLAVNFYGFALNVQDDFTRTLLNLLDGTRTREDLLDELNKITKSNDDTADEQMIPAQLPEMMERDLFIFSKMGFLVG